MRGIIYCIKQKGTGYDSPIYIGSTKDFYNRKKEHKHYLKDCSFEITFQLYLRILALHHILQWFMRYNFAMY